MWCVPEADADYVARMEDVLDQYEQAYDPKRPLICYDEGLKQLIEETRRGMPAKPGKVERYDYEYKRNGVRNLNLAFEPLIGKRFVRITARHTSQDFAHCMKWLVDELHPEAEVIRVVLDNLGPHKPAALYETYPPEEARRIVKKLEFHYTPKHGSWLNMAEIELSVYSRSLKRHISTEEMLVKEVQALTNERNANQTKVDWQFFTADARIKLKQLYPSISN
jgi:transposase